MKNAIAIAVLLVAACGASSEDGTGTTSDRSFQNTPPTDVAASDAEALTVLDIGPVENVKTKQPIELRIFEREDGSAESDLHFLATAAGYTVGIGLGDPLNRTEWTIGDEGLDVLTSISIEDIADRQIVRMESGTASASIQTDTATITITNAGAVEMERAVSGSVSGKLVRSCHNRVPARPDAQGNPSTEQTMPQLDAEWDSAFCSRQK